MDIKIIAKMTAKERDSLMEHYHGWTIEEIVFDIVAPKDNFQNIEVYITD